ncbi:WEB family protein, chloroplastic [Heracleum sosnowskyi]|uniref:WEB family protein, chloroplastic n=1 Tax=Heracleum sosnowskyi TaxID=360622 RepID=A0AAD8HFV9_9APIA|nr:WEB family protein, chloroplastic [Heracleum sosnowskyi]
MATKSKFNLNKSTLVETLNSKASTETPNNKASDLTPTNKASNVNNTTKVSPATPRIPKLSRGIAKSETDSPSPLQSSRLSIDRSPKTVTSKTSVDRRSPKLSTTPDKQPIRLSKGSELQVQLNLVQEDLKKAKEKLAEVEKEKEQAIGELREAQKLAEEANGKLTEALVAQKRAEEESEIEKFRTVEMEQAGIDANQKKEEEWQMELEDVRNQHALDVSALLAANQELHKVKLELARTSDAKNQALSHADEATQIAEIHVEKVEIMSAELSRLKAFLECRNTSEANNKDNIVLELKSDVETLKQQLQNANDHQKKAMENEAELENLSVELEAARMAESYSQNLLEEWQKRVEELEIHAEKANHLEKSASESLDSIMKQLEESNDSLHDAESEIASLKEKVGLLEMSIGSQRADLEISERSLYMAKEQASEMAQEVESLKCELDTFKEEKIQALNNEKFAAESVQTLLEEKNKLTNELETFKIEEEKSKKAMESLTSALHEASSDAREAKEKLLSSEDEHQNLETQVENLKLVLRASNEKYEGMLHDAKQEIDVLTNLIQQTEHDHQTAKTEREQRELHLMDCINKSEEECSSMTKELSKLVSSLKEAESEASAGKEEEARLKNTLEEAESEIDYLKEVLGEAKAESMKLKEGLLNKENEVQSVIQENEELRNKESACMIKVKELSQLLEEATMRKQAEESVELTESEKDGDMLPKEVEFFEHNGDQKEENTKAEIPHLQELVKEIPLTESNKMDVKTVETGTETTDKKGKPKENESKEKDDYDSVELISKMWESGKIEDKEFLEKESVEEVGSKTENDRLDQINGFSSNGGSSPPTKEQSHKKKKPLLHKFGSLLKKKSTSNQK